MSSVNITGIKINRHPILWLRHLLSVLIENKNLSTSAIIKFSKYKYKPQTYEDSRKVFDLSVFEINKSTLFDILMDLEDDEELALHSEIIDMDKIYHLPLIDFGGKDNKLFESTFRNFCDFWDIEFQIFSSGRSYHAYGNRLLSEKQWISFMGSLLLLNIPGASKIIDDRWVGHRILGGYAALRWSKNTIQYKKYPTHIGTLNAQGFYNEELLQNFKSVGKKE